MRLSTRINTVCVMGLGYIGLPTASILASRGVHVIGVDTNADVVAKINGGEIHIVEPDLDAVVAHVVRQGLLRATTTPEPADAFVIAVPTPFHDNQPDVSYIAAAAKAIAPHLAKGNLIILESTSPPGTTKWFASLLADLRKDLTFPRQGVEGDGDVSIAYCPERVLPGRVLVELVQNDRVIGGITARCSDRAAAFYQIFCEGECLTADAETAEMCKLTENAFRDINIAFANELSMICGKIGVNVWDLIELANHHPRVKILQPGAGVGGHCIAVDPWFIVAAAPERAHLIRTAREVNDSKPEFVIAKIEDAIRQCGGDGRELRVAILGIAFKPDVDDLRESPALTVLRRLAGRQGLKIQVVEPNLKALPAPFAQMPHVTLASIDDIVGAVDVIALLVAHKQFRAEINRIVAKGIVVDVVGLSRLATAL